MKNSNSNNNKQTMTHLTACLVVLADMKFWSYNAQVWRRIEVFMHLTNWLIVVGDIKF
jgi:hypothetical protein